MNDIPEAIRARVAFVAIREWAAAGYAYEKRDNSWLKDHEFDELSRWLKANYDWLKPFDLNGYLNKDDLSTGTASGMADRVCGQTLEYAEYRMKERTTTGFGLPLSEPRKDK